MGPGRSEPDVLGPDVLAPEVLLSAGRLTEILVPEVLGPEVLEPEVELLGPKFLPEGGTIISSSSESRVT